MAEDFNKLRLLVRQLVKTKFRQNWQWKVVDDEAPSDLDLYAKDITYGPIEIETEPETVGAKTFTWPTAAAPVTVSMTMRDNEDRRIHKWFESMVGKIFPKNNGLVAVPTKYLLNFTRYSLVNDGREEVETDKWQVFPQQLGDVTESREDPEFLEFPITFVQFMSMGTLHLGQPTN